MDRRFLTKVLFVAGIIVASAAFTAGADISDDFDTLEYDKEEEVAFICEGSGCPSSETIQKHIIVSACGYSHEVEYNGGDEWRTELAIPHQGDWFSGTEFSCDVGTNSYAVYDDEIGSNVYLGSETFKVGYSHGELAGGILALTTEFHDITQDEIHTWQIYNGGAFDGGENGEIRIKEVSKGTEYYEALTGYVLSESRSGKGFVNELNDMMTPYYTGSCNAGDICTAAKMELGNDMSDDCHGNCPMGRMDEHDAADYKLRGEIIVGVEVDPSNGLTTGGSVAKEQKKFHLCDTSVHGIHDIEDRVVYSPGDKFDADNFICKDDQWIERPKCSPSEEFRDGSRGWDCYEKDPTTIDVQYFDIGNIPYGDLTSSFIAGFRIPGSELNNFEAHYQPNDVRLKHVQAECWMGNNDNRPSSNSKKGEVRVEASDYRNSGPGTVPSSFEDMWVLTQIPYREDVINDTYSCVYGFDARFGEYNDVMFQAVNDFTLNSKDSGKIGVDYRNLQDIYSNNQGSYVDGLQWPWDSSVDDRSIRFDAGGDYSDSQLNPFEQEHPYCPGPPPGNDVIC